MTMFAIVDDITPSRATVIATFESREALRDAWFDAPPTGPREHEKPVQVPEGTEVGERIQLGAVEVIDL